MAFRVFLICGTDPSEQVAAWRLQTLATAYGMHVSVPNRNGSVRGGLIDRVRHAIDQSDCVLAIITETIGPTVIAELNYALSKRKLIVSVMKEGVPVPPALREVPTFQFSPWNSGQTEAAIVGFLQQQEMSKKNLQSMAAFILTGLGVFLFATLAEK